MYSTYSFPKYPDFLKMFMYLSVPGLSCRTQDLFLVAACRIFTCSMDLVPGPGIKPGSPALRV